MKGQLEKAREDQAGSLEKIKDYEEKMKAEASVIEENGKLNAQVTSLHEVGSRNGRGTNRQTE